MIKDSQKQSIVPVTTDDVIKLHCTTLWWCWTQTVPDVAEVEDRVEDENCNGDMESMETDTDAVLAIDHLATESTADVPCCHPPEPLTSSEAVHNLCWFVLYSQVICL